LDHSLGAIHPQEIHQRHEIIRGVGYHRGYQVARPNPQKPRIQADQSCDDGVDPGEPMKAKQSAGLIMSRVRNDVLQVLLVHPGGPFWANKDAGAWSIPKGEVDPGEDLLCVTIQVLPRHSRAGPIY
jgi:hypothetical protein